MPIYASTIVWVKYLKASIQALAHYATIILSIICMVKVGLLS